MTLDDAIKHCQQVADESVCECADEHRQLAKWLQELKEFKQKQTNEEWLRSCATEQLAEFLNLIIRVGPYENEPKDFWEHVYGRGGENGAKSIVMWLKQPHTTIKE